MSKTKYFVANAVYGAADMNETVSDLRKDGVFGEIIDCLKVTKVSGTTVAIAVGKGWVDGCKIKVTATESLTLPTTDGEYSVIMKLTTTGGVVVDIDFAYESGSTAGNHVLAWVTVASGVISGTPTDKRVNSTFNGATQIITGTADWQAGDKILLSDTGAASAIYSTYFKIKNYRVGNSGVVRVSFDLRSNGSSGCGRIYKNDIAVGTERSTTISAYVPQPPEDITVAANDEISIYAKTTNSTVEIKNVNFGIARGSDIIQPI